MGISKCGYMTVSINTEIIEKRWISTCGHMTQWEHQHQDPWRSVNVNTGTHELLRISTDHTSPTVYLNNIWPGMYINMDMYVKVRTTTQGYLSVKNNMVIHDQLCLWTVVYMTKSVYQHRDLWPTVNINMRLHSQVWISISSTWPIEKSNTGIHVQLWIPTVRYMTYMTKC